VYVLTLSGFENLTLWVRPFQAYIPSSFSESQAKATKTHKILTEGINERTRGREEDKEIFIFLQI
jgi:hypothetical protein